jgi:hypothetical protein
MVFWLASKPLPTGHVSAAAMEQCMMAVASRLLRLLCHVLARGVIGVATGFPASHAGTLCPSRWGCVESKPPFF